jgi:HPt (histidine-containing phosphotransfer) domain-containing protein
MNAAKVMLTGGLDHCPEATNKASVIDEEHLSRMTLADPSLEREVLQIYVRQSAIMLGRMTSGDPATVAAAAHTLNGSARGIGAWRVAKAAEQLEQASNAGGEPMLSEALTELKAASLEAGAAVAARLGNPQARQALP